MRNICINMIFILLLVMNIQQAYADEFKIRISPLSADFYLEDINGNVSGYYPPSGFIVGELPYMDSYRKNGESDVNNPTPEQQWHELHLDNLDSTIPTGKYKLVVFGSNLIQETKIIIRIDIYKNGNSTGIMPVDYILPGLMYKYEFDIATVPTGSNINFTKVVNSQDMLMEINVLAKLGYIGNQHFVSELIKEINEIEAEKVKGKIDDGVTPAEKAKKEYQELIKELMKKNEKPEKDEYINDLAFVILKKDIEYIINHIQ